MANDIWLKMLVFALVIPANWKNETSVLKLASNVVIAIAAVGFAIYDAALADGAPVGWIVSAILYAYSSGDQYWKLFHADADQESKWAWRRWQEAEYEKKREAWWRIWGDGPVPTSTEEVRQ